MELFTKKNILIGSLVLLVAIPTALIGIPKVQERIERYTYAQGKKKRPELGATKEKLKENIHSVLKNKNRENAYAIHCMDGGNNTRIARKSKDNTFNNFWEQVVKEDYSKSTVRLEKYDGKQSPSIYIENIKADGQTFSRSFGVAGIGGRSNPHYCSSLVPLWNYESKTYLSDEEMKRYENP